MKTTDPLDELEIELMYKSLGFLAATKKAQAAAEGTSEERDALIDAVKKAMEITVVYGKFFRDRNRDKLNETPPT